MRIRLPGRRLGILLSGRGSNFQAIADNTAKGVLEAEIAVVISNRADAAGLAEARRRGYDTVHLSSADVAREEFDAAVLRELRARDVSLVCLAGFMRILSPVLVGGYPDAILNIHPSLLPSFPGLEPQRQALDHGVAFSGCTVHLVDESLDGGPIVRQGVVPVEAGDTVETLAARILEEEHRVYPAAVADLLSGRCERVGRRLVMHGGN